VVVGAYPCGRPMSGRHKAQLLPHNPSESQEQLDHCTGLGQFQKVLTSSNYAGAPHLFWPQFSLAQVRCTSGGLYAKLLGSCYNPPLWKVLVKIDVNSGLE